MGSRMATRLLNAGYPLGVFNRNADKTRPFVERGARAFDSPRDLAQHAEVVLSSPADDAAVAQTLLGADGAIAGARAARPGRTKAASPDDGYGNGSHATSTQTVKGKPS